MASLPQLAKDVNGFPLHSWRTLILSRLERANVYDKIDRDAAWDSPANRVASSTEVDQFQCESNWNPASPNRVCYFAIVGPHTAWPGEREVSDDRNNRPEVIHNLADGSTRPPYALGKPSDISFDDAVRLLSDPPSSNDMHKYRPSNEFFAKTLG